MNSSDNFQDSALSRLMPLMNSSFTPGQAQATVDNFQDLAILRNILNVSLLSHFIIHTNCLPFSYSFHLHPE